MKKSLLILFVAIYGLLLNSGLSAQSKITPQQVAQKTAALITNARGLSANFTIQGNGRTGKGWIKSAGSKFNVGIPGAEVWYNGKDLYTYSSRSNETTVISPTAAELLESNPLLYVRDGGGAYNYSFSPVKRNDKYVVDLTPKNQKNDIKKLTFTVNSSTFRPERIVVVTRQGTMTIDISDLKTDLNLDAASFEYPKNKYPKAELVDLR